MLECRYASWWIWAQMKEKIEGVEAEVERLKCCLYLWVWLQQAIAFYRRGPNIGDLFFELSFLVWELNKIYSEIFYSWIYQKLQTENCSTYVIFWSSLGLGLLLAKTFGGKIDLSVGWQRTKRSWWKRWKLINPELAFQVFKSHLALNLAFPKHNLCLIWT